MTLLTIGSRGSALALAQTNLAAEQMKSHSPEISIRIEVIQTKGDRILDTPLASIGDKGLFVKEVEQALIEGRIDIAVHSLKDLPSEMTPGLKIAAVPQRVDPCDALISPHGRLDELPVGAGIGSSSLRRRAQIKNRRSDLNVVDIRGNLDTRLRKLESGEYDGIIVAMAGLLRLGWRGNIAERLDCSAHIPAVGQGALAIQTREDDLRALEIVEPLNDFDTLAAVTAERSLLSALGGGCQTPIAALATRKDDLITMDAMVASVDGVEMLRASSEDLMKNAESLGRRVAQTLLDSGADRLLNRNNGV